MGISIYVDDNSDSCVLVCNTTMRPFGQAFDSACEADAFCDWVDEDGRYSVAQLMDPKIWEGVRAGWEAVKYHCPKCSDWGFQATNGKDYSDPDFDIVEWCVDCAEEESRIEQARKEGWV